MDLSKLPRLSETSDRPHPIAPAIPVPPASAPPPGAPATASVPTAPSFTSADVWISIALGLILLFAFRTPIEYFTSRNNPSAFEEKHLYYDKDTSPMPYRQTGYFLADLGVDVFAIVLILEGLVLAMARRPVVVAAALVLTAGATLFNLYVVLKTYNTIGFSIICALAVAFGTYIALYQVNLLGSFRATRRAGHGN